ncbi:hypothetical protein WMY93_005227 [Mugilogobius chulae]|uniref:Ig-like domain-containing protein n=1 Tax=Mugilogobius chulae TaxID=88201 RepID=A0AAW0Q1H2_9GOBI
MTCLLCLLFLPCLTVSSQLGLDEVFFSPQDQAAREGETVFFPCVSGESSPPASISWLKDGKPVTRGRQIQGEYGGGNQRKTSGTLHLYNITVEDDGTYICITYNPLLNISKMSNKAKLVVQGKFYTFLLSYAGVPRKLQFIHAPDNITVAMGEEVSMRCVVGGFPVPMVHWFKDDCLLTNCSAPFRLQNNGQLLTFRTSRFYHCEAFNQKEIIKSQKGYLLLADMDWNFVEQPVNMTVKKGDNVTVNCRPPDSRPPAHVSWFKNNRPLTTSADLYVLPSGDLYFHRVNEDDSGSYFCRASNIHLQRFITSRRASITVLGDPPSVSLWPQVHTVPLGARVVLQCQATGSPLPSISWFKNGHSKQTGGRVLKGLSNATLYIQSAKSYDEGVYVCLASNSMGNAQSNAVLKVAVSPLIVNFATRVQSRIGGVAILPCKAVGIVPITYTWSRKQGNSYIPIAPNDEIYYDGDGSLHISNVQWSDQGEYYCTAKNRAGQNQKRSVLTVTGVSSHCSGQTEFFTEDTSPPSLHMLPLTNKPSPYFVTQMPPPIFPPPPHSNFKSASPQHIPASSHLPHTDTLLLKSHFMSDKFSDGSTQTLDKQQITGELHKSLTEFPKTSQETVSPFAPILQVGSKHKEANILLPKFENETTGTSEAKLELPKEPMHLKEGNQPTPISFEKSYIYTHSYSESTLISRQVQAYGDHLPTLPTQQSHLNSSNIESPVFNQTASYSIDVHTAVAKSHPINQTYNTSTFVSDLNVENITKQEDTSDGEQSVEATTEKSTSQSPRVTQQAPSWLPVLEKHDIPIVVGVGVSLAFIFITVTFYSMVQKNEPVPTNRAAQRNVGVPKRNTSRRIAGRTYENRAFEDDDCVAVIEQSPNTRARPPGPGLVTVQLEPTSEEQDISPSPDLYSVTVETYPEPILDTKIDHSLEEESGLSLSQPSIQLQCTEDWFSGADDNHSPCQDTLPPPSPLPSASPSPSLTPKLSESLRSSLTLQSGELSTAPIHHSLSVSHSSSPLFLSHHVSFGPTNIAVDVHFQPVSTPSISVQSSTQINTSSMLIAPLADSQESVHTK